MSTRPTRSPGAPRPETIAVRLNRWALAFSQRWLAVLLTVIGIFVSLPWVAPVLMKVGLTGPGEFLYTVYSPLCHQLPFRSWFLFGQQTAYPLEAARLRDFKPFEAYLNDVSKVVGPITFNPDGGLDLRTKGFNGNDSMGWKVAVCQRDVGIYLGLFLGGLFFAVPHVRARLRPVPLWLYAWLGLGPIAIDGVSQLLSAPLPGLGLPLGLWPLRETTPFFRTVTGLLFGLMNAWLAFPYLEQSARETAQEIRAKFAQREKREQMKARLK